MLLKTKKRAFSLLEIVFVILILSLLVTFFRPKFNNNKLNTAANRIVLYLKQTRYQALIDDKKDESSKLWHKKRWTLKFFRCRKSVGGIYYSIYSDNNLTGHASLEESLLDPLTNKRIYSSNKCEYTKTSSKYVLLSKEFDVALVDVSCNKTSSLGQISFGNDGKIYSKLSNKENEENEYEIQKSCKITLRSHKNEEVSILIDAKSAYARVEK